MSVFLNPSDTLDFRRPLTILVKRPLTITNNNAQPVAFKIKTTAPKQYCANPNSGRVEPGESIDVSIMLQALKEEPPLDTRCKDRFLIQSTIITPDKENLALHDIWASLEIYEGSENFRHKLRVTYLPAEGHRLEEEEGEEEGEEEEGEGEEEEEEEEDNDNEDENEDDEDTDDTASNVTVKEFHPDAARLPAVAKPEFVPEPFIVSLNPRGSLDFRRPLTTLVKRSLTITNYNPQPVAFKVKTTAPKLYCVRPNVGRVEPGESVDVSIVLQPLKEDPPLYTRCKDKFLIQSTIITPDKENLTLRDIWTSPETTTEGKVFQKMLRVTYLTAEGQTLEERNESADDETASNFTAKDSPVIEPTVAEPIATLVSLNPSSVLGFNRPLTSLVKRSLNIINNNSQPIAFKIKTTTPKQYCVRPNFGRVRPGESISISIMLQSLKEEPPLDAKCKDKFLIQSIIITPDKEDLTLHDIWTSPEIHEEGKVFGQKLRVTYLPAEGQIIEEEEESADETESNFTANEWPVLESIAAEHEKALVSLNPSSAFGFNRPLTAFAKRTLTITNDISEPVAFKIKSKSPEQLYSISPYLGRVEAGDSIDVLVVFQGLNKEPPLNAVCKDKFLVQSTIITPDKENLALQEIWANPKINEDKIFQQKLRVTYLPSEDRFSFIRYWLSRMKSKRVPVNGNIFAHPDSHLAPASSQKIAHDEQHAHLPPTEVLHAAQVPELIHGMHENPKYEEMAKKYSMAQEEIERLKTQIGLLTAQLELKHHAAGLEETPKGSNIDSTGIPSAAGQASSANVRI